MKQENHDCTRLKHRTEDEKRKLTKRLSIIEGQVRGIKQMIENDRYCDDILIQIAAINNSLKTIGYEMLKNHLSTCVVQDIKNEKLEVIDDVINLIKRLS